MTNSIADIIGGKSFAEPEEIRIIKNYIFEHYQANAGVTVNEKTITIKVTSSALANTLRFELRDLQQKCKTDKKLLLRIGR